MTKPFIDPASIGDKGQIVGATYGCENYCRRCIRRMANAKANRAYASMLPALKAWAELEEVNLEDESSYDSEDFPKPFGRNQIEPGERCPCGMAIR